MVFRQPDGLQNYFSWEYETRFTYHCIKHFSDMRRYNAIHLEVQWLPRTDLEKADYISRFIDIDDWQISNDCFYTIETLWGIHTVDCFAN